MPKQRKGYGRAAMHFQPAVRQRLVKSQWDGFSLRPAHSRASSARKHAWRKENVLKTTYCSNYLAGIIPTSLAPDWTGHASKQAR